MFVFFETPRLRFKTFLRTATHCSVKIIKGNVANYCEKSKWFSEMCQDILQSLKHPDSEHAAFLANFRFDAAKNELSKDEMSMIAGKAGFPN